ncbi:MAG: polymer-forming cytoskeletal protein [Deltaproteobacteria bacterium]|nr:polymer-forming cytoskeletal protein [Deltaproteobacteria bacterium]
MFSKEKEDKAKGGEVIGLIGKGMFIEGRLTFENTVRIDGNFKGQINAGGTLVVGDTGMVEGEVTVDTAIITGEVVGIVEAKTRVELQAPAKFQGEIRTPNLIIGDGAVFDGKCVMLKKDSARQETAHFQYQEEGHQESANF